MQLELLRKYPTIQGSVYFSSKTFYKNPNGWNDSLQNNYYRNRAAVPPMPWLPPRPGSGVKPDQARILTAAETYLYLLIREAL